MERYISQLLADLEAAQKKEVPPFRLDKNDDIVRTSMERFSGLEKNSFPPVEMLTQKQLQDLVDAIFALLDANHYHINLPKRLPLEITYQKLLEKWTDKIHYVKAGLYGLDFCPDEPATCELREWCHFFCEEVDPKTIPVYNGIYDFKGNKIDITDIPVPDLCLSCASFLDDDWEENLLCNMTRAGKREENEEFKCYAWRKKRTK